MKVRIGYDASFSVNNYRGMGVFMNAFKNVLLQYPDIEIKGLSCYETSEDGIKKTGSTIYPLWEQISLPLYLRKNKPDIFIFPYNTMPWFVPRSIYKVLILHDLIFLEKIYGTKQTFKQFIGKHYSKFLVRRAYRKADVFITVSEHSKKKMLNLLGAKSKIYVIPNVVKKQLEYTGKTEKTANNYLLNIGGEAPSKNVFTLIAAYCLLPEKLINDYQLKLVGNYSGSFIKAAQDHLQKKNIPANRIEFTGYVSDDTLSQLYCQCSAFIFPSLFEGFGIPVIEAIQYEKPLLASNTSCIPEIAGKCALYFDPLSVDDIKNKIEFVLSDNYQFNDYKKYYKEQLQKFSFAEFEKKVRALIDDEILNNSIGL
jgi:glycosyltransferase involved in cell wall biosynthesis